jgi:hypothetical protein
VRLLRRELQHCASEINVQANNATLPGKPFKKRTEVRTHLAVAGNLLGLEADLEGSTWILAAREYKTYYSTF